MWTPEIIRWKDGVITWPEECQRSEGTTLWCRTWRQKQWTSGHVQCHSQSPVDLRPHHVLVSEITGVNLGGRVSHIPSKLLHGWAQACNGSRQKQFLGRSVKLLGPPITVDHDAMPGLVGDVWRCRWVASTDVTNVFLWLKLKDSVYTHWESWSCSPDFSRIREKPRHYSLLDSPPYSGKSALW